MTDAPEIRQQLAGLNPHDPSYAIAFVEALLAAARTAKASDVHLQPTREGLDVRWRLDGVLQSVGVFPKGTHGRRGVPPESAGPAADLPLRSAARGSDSRPAWRNRDAREHLSDLARRTRRHPTVRQPAAIPVSWKISASRPKSTPRSASCCARHPVPSSCPDPRAAVRQRPPMPACASSCAPRKGAGPLCPSKTRSKWPSTASLNRRSTLQAGFDLTTGLHSLMRQDPEAILVGEIRDRAAAATVFQAALTGHVVVTTFHAGSAAGPSAA